jgi:hypothetical protein
MRSSRGTSRCTQCVHSQSCFTVQLRGRCVARCEPRKDGLDTPSSSEISKRVEELQQADVDKEKAQEILDLWKESGVTDDPEALRKLYRDRGTSSFGRLGIQLFLDAGACWAVRISTSG